jgi:hypothetical protein
MASTTCNRQPTAEDEDALRGADKLCARILRANLEGAVSLRAKRAADLGLEVKGRSVGMMNVIRWQRHKVRTLPWPSQRFL